MEIDRKSLASKDVVKYEFDYVKTDMMIASGILILSHLVLTSYDDIIVHLHFISTNNDYDYKL